jgi:hypothetical protein
MMIETYSSIILPDVLCGCETCALTLTLKEEHRLRKFADKMLRKISGHGRVDATGDWRKLHNGELCDYDTK